MTKTSHPEFKSIFPASHAHLSSSDRDRFRRAWKDQGDPETSFAEMEGPGVPAFLPDLARIEHALYRVRNRFDRVPSELRERTVNPTLELVPCTWRGLLPLALEPENAALSEPLPGEEVILVWCMPGTNALKTRVAGPSDLLALKTIVEKLDPAAIAQETGRPVGLVDEALGFAVQRGLLLGPPSRIRRDPGPFPEGSVTDEAYLSSPVFTIQWHVTQACDLACKHCYDRSQRSPLALDDGIRILDELRDFCLDRNVWGQVTFSGGNPFLYEHFFALYEEARLRGFSTAVAGNPAPAGKIDRLTSIQKPAFYQVSLEGLREHNDAIRGAGYFNRVMDFLDLLRDRGVFSMVMLTLTQKNVDQVLPLGEILREKTDLFTFNRLAMVGEGANLQGVAPERYEAFLKEYVAAAKENPVLRLKDNLINILHYRAGRPVFGGCAGYGCGAAFNFVSILPDGEVHACRKLPSEVGNLHHKSLSEIYDSEPASRYRNGPSDCRDCSIRAVCGGCLAVVYGLGLDVFKDRDPYCFMEESEV